MTASKLATPRRLFPSLTPIVCKAGRTHADVIDRFPVSVAMGAPLRTKLPIRIRVDVAYKKITEYQGSPIAKRKWKPIDARKFGYNVSVRPSARTHSGGRGKKTQ